MKNSREENLSIKIMFIISFKQKMIQVIARKKFKKLEFQRTKYFIQG